MLPFANPFTTISYRTHTKKQPPARFKTDYWKYRGDNLAVAAHAPTKVAVKYLKRNGYNAAFGAISVYHGKHIWKLKIIKKTTKICVGISASTESINRNFHRQKTYPNYGYNWDGSKISHCTKYESYAIPIKTGQIITIILDLDKQQISFMNDNHDLGVAFNDIIIGQTVKYRVALSMVDMNDKVQIIGYGKLTDDDSEISGPQTSDDSKSHSNDLISSSKEESKDGDEKKEEIDDNIDLNVHDIESWDNKMCIQWIRNTVNKEMDEINGMDMLKMFQQLHHQNGTYAKQEALKLKYDQQSKLLQSYQQKLVTLNQKHDALEKKIDTINDEKDNLLLLYQVKDEEIQIAKMENQRLRCQLLKLQKCLTST